MFRLLSIVLAVVFGLGPLEWSRALAADSQAVALAQPSKDKDDKDKKNPPNPNPGNGNPNPGNPNPNPNPGNPTPSPSPANPNPSNPPKNPGTGNPNPGTPPSNSNPGTSSKPPATGNPSPGNPTNPPKTNPVSTPTRGYYAQVTLNTPGQIQAGDTRIKSDSPWLSIAAPGMWIEASGHWEGEVFVAEELKLQAPQSWSYYQGPAGLVGASDYEYVEAWLSTDRSHPFLYLKTALEQAKQVKVVAYFDGKKLRAIPSSFPPPPAGTPLGWVELLGTVGAQGIVWNSAKAFP